MSGTSRIGPHSISQSPTQDSSSAREEPAAKRTRLEGPAGLDARPGQRAESSRASRSSGAPRTPIFIGNRDDARGGGRQWDHVTVQALTGRETVGVASAAQADVEKPKEWFSTPEFPRYPTGVPQMHTDGRVGEGLLIIPGGPTSLPTEQPAMRFPPKAGREGSATTRQEHQGEMLRAARNTGQPVLAICGGSWHLAAAFGGNTQTSPEFEAKHVARMPTLLPAAGSTSDGQPALAVAHAGLIQHEISVDGQSMLGSAMRGPTDARTTGESPVLKANVNSVHWAEVVASEKEGRLEISGTDPMPSHRPRNPTDHAAGAHVVPATATSELVQVTATARDESGRASVEGFETRHGAPVVGVQYHPEALAGRPNEITAEYTADRYSAERGQAERLFDFMAKAGDAFAARKEMTREFQGLMGADAMPPHAEGQQPAAGRALDVALRNKDI